MAWELPICSCALFVWVRSDISPLDASCDDLDRASIWDVLGRPCLVMEDEPLARIDPCDLDYALIAIARSKWRLLEIDGRSEEHTSELQSLRHLVCRLLL